VIRHSEERSDEESLFLLAKIQEGFLAALGMTDLVHFSATCSDAGIFFAIGKQPLVPV
jgi:hypothetical protein